MPTNRPTPIDRLLCVASGYLLGDPHDLIAATCSLTSTAMVHTSLQTIRRRTGEHTNVAACQALTENPSAFDMPYRHDGMRAERDERRRLRAQGLSYRQIGQMRGGVSGEAVRQSLARDD